jgi:hypothetical protein
MKGMPDKFQAAILITIVALMLATLSVLHDVLAADAHNEWLTHELWSAAKMVLATIIGYFLGRNGHGRL